MKNYGLILEDGYRGSDDIFGGISRSFGQETWNESGQWEDYLPIKELQRRFRLETMACVSFSALNVIETLHRFKFKEEVNYSDRFTAKISGTTPRGNTFANVANSIRKYGVIPEDEWKFEDGKWDDYYETLPDILKTRAQAWSGVYDVKYEYVMDNVDVQEALSYSPLQVGVYAWNTPINGIYPKTTKRSNHGVTLYGYKEGEYWEIYDHYENVKKKLAWDYIFGVVLKYSLETKQKPMLNLSNNTLVQEVEISGKFGLYLDNKILIGDEAKLALTFMQRNNGNIKDKVRSLTVKDWDLFDKYTLGNKKI